MSSREEFEAWHAKQVQRLMEHNEPTAARVWNDFKGMHWNAWQASREALVIERPEKCEFADPDGPYHKGYRQGMRNMVDAIEAAGLKVKP